jgi:hypothetical protein
VTVLPADGPGGGAGPGGKDYVIETQNPNVLQQAGGKVVDAVTVLATETTYDVGYTFTVPTSTWQGQEFDVYAADVASWIQVIAQHEHVVAMYGAQDIDRNGLLQDYLFVTVGIDGTDSTALVQILLSQANTPGAFAKIDAAYNLLVKRQNGE